VIRNVCQQHIERLVYCIGLCWLSSYNIW